MISCPTVRKEVIRSHYNLATLFYRLLWGRHIHHGLWHGGESPTVAQRQLTETLAREAGVQRGEAVLDVGCGMGGSSILLAKEFDCRVTGITLSPLQRRWARCSSRWHGTHRQTEFRCVDAERAEFDAASFLVVWSIECTEPLFDKPAFFRKAADWLRSGGRMAICAWLAGDASHAPVFGTSRAYSGWTLCYFSIASTQFSRLTEQASCDTGASSLTNRDPPRCGALVFNR